VFVKMFRKSHISNHSRKSSIGIGLTSSTMLIREILIK
jgi:hypothetical protein